MHRRRFLATLGVSGAVGGAGCQSDNSDGTPARTTSGSDRSSRRSTGDTEQPVFRVRDDGFERRTDDGYESLTARGLNIGMAKPGYFPGSAAITRDEYDRWIAHIGAIANVIRTYTIHPPAFYRALADYNAGTTDPLYLLQGTWVPHDPLVQASDATAISGMVDQEIERTVDVVHGDATLPDRRGHASGTYDADVHDALLGYLFGIEWPPDIVSTTNEAIGAGSFAGSYLESEGSAFERWLTERLESIVAHETETYGTQSPVGFVNWVTTDPLEHPYEPFVSEDAVSIDPDTVSTTDAFTPGTFAAYHVYPYYPDLLNETPEYVNYVDHRGEANSYAGYLNDLASATDLPLLIAEFGVPSSRGIAHRDVHGRDQGQHTEQAQGEIVSAMYEDIIEADTAGGIAFTWQNEWFKRTWNLDARSVPGRRPYWSNIQTPEQRFGLLAFDPDNAISLSGNASEWSDAAVSEPATTAGVDPVRQLEELRVSHSAEGLELRLMLQEMSEPVAWDQVNLLLTVGLRGESTPLPLHTAATAVADFVVHLAGESNSRMLVESSYDAFAREFGTPAGLPIADYQNGNAGFVPVREPINLGYTVPPTGEEVPFESVETGQLTYGNGDPSAAVYDSLTDVHVDHSARTIEVRLPWVLLNVADPSTKQRIASDWEDGLATVSFESVTVGAATYRPDGDGQAQGVSGETNITHAIPGLTSGELNTSEYSWETWSESAYTERLKESYHTLEREWG
ncbi:hypothetical protein [Haloarcula laminariae]|uniref:hypothetical protein n=1 Tax=Haloarcula laminariae TaxID=2961577 RepID=UPI0021CA3AC3|nr:hypothetical protein [Halomicroarcula laminariae]